MAPKTKSPETDDRDEVPNGIILLATHLRDAVVVLENICEQMIERNSMLRNVQGEPAESQYGQTVTGRIDRLEKIAGVEAVAPLFDRVAKLETAVGTIPGRMDELTALVKDIPTLLKAQHERLTGASAEETRAPANGETKAIANRIIEHVVENASPPKRGRGRPANPEKCPHPADKVETLENGLRRCTRCGAVLEAAKGETLQSVAANISPTPAEKVAAAVTTAVQAGRADVAQKIAEKVIAGPPVVIETAKAQEMAAKAVEEMKAGPIAPAKPEPVYKFIDGKAVEVDPETLKPITKVEEPKAEEKKPEPTKVEEPKATIDDVRAVAIGFADKHGKEKLGEVLRKYGQGNLSSIAPERYRDVMAELSAEAG